MNSPKGCRRIGVHWALEEKARDLNCNFLTIPPQSHPALASLDDFITQDKSATFFAAGWLSDYTCSPRAPGTPRAAYAGRRHDQIVTSVVRQEWAAL